MPRRPASRSRNMAGRARRTFAAVEAIGRTLPDVEVGTAWGQPALKVRGKMFACLASHKSAEPNSLVVMMAFADRDALVEEGGAAYYLEEHYRSYPCVLVRLDRIGLDALRDLVAGAHRFVDSQTPRKPRRGTESMRRQIPLKASMPRRRAGRYRP